MVLIKTTIEEEAEEILTIEEAEVVEVSVVNLHSFILSIISNKVNLVLVGLDQIGLCVKFVESLAIWLWIAITGWTMLIKASIHLQSLQQWLQLLMPASLKISPGLLTVQPLIT